MNRLLRYIFFFICSCLLGTTSSAEVPPQTPLYGIAPGANLKQLEVVLGNPTQRLPFDDGWVAVIYQFKGHNVIVETAPDDPEYVVAVQIEGHDNPNGKGLLNVNLGDNIDSVLKAFGTPLERRPSIDERTNAEIPNAYIYQYKSASFESTHDKITSIKVHFENKKVTTVVPQSAIKPVSLLNYTYERWQAFTVEKYSCKEARVLTAKTNPTSTKGVISERWQTDVCGQQRVFFPILVPNGDGGYLISFGE
jgi:hypothetical protein